MIALLEYYAVTALLESLTALSEYLSGIVQIVADPALISIFAIA